MSDNQIEIVHMQLPEGTTWLEHMEQHYPGFTEALRERLRWYTPYTEIMYIPEGATIEPRGMIKP